MLVPGLKNSLLSRITSSDESYSSIRDRLCECAWELIVKYKQKQESGKKLTIKTRAAQELLSELKQPGSQSEARAIISSALKHHAQALQCYEHLLSKKGNTYALIKQTLGLRDSHDHASASLLRYHELKDKFLGPETRLDDEQRKVLSELVEKKDLTLKMLEAIDKDFPTDSRVHDISGTTITPANISTGICIDIRNVMTKAGYHPCKKGMCYGLAWTALLACVRRDGQAYMERIQYLKRMCVPPLLRADALQVYPFFDTVTLSQTNYESMDGYDKGLGYPGRQEVAFPGRVIASHRPGYEVIPVVERAFIAECTPATFIQFLQQTRENNKGIPFGVMISYMTHVTSIGFDGEKWLATNHDFHYHAETIDLLSDFFHEQSCQYNVDKILAEMKVIAGNGHSLNINSRALAVNVKKSVAIFQVLYLALKQGDVNVITDCITVISQQAHTHETLFAGLNCRSARGYTGFYMALQNGHPEAITAFIKASAEKLATFDLTDAKKAELLCELLICKNADGIPGFCMAFYLDHYEAVTAFIQESAAVITRLLLSKREKVKWLYKLLACKIDDGTPGFSLALQKGHSKTITAFIKASAVGLTTFDLPEAEKARLLCKLFACKNAAGIPGFSMTLQNGHPEAIIAFIQESAAVIARLSLSKRKKAKWLYELLASKNEHGIPGFSMTLQKGHSEAITAFIKASAEELATFDLSDTEKAKLLSELLTCKNADGIPGFSMTLQKGHSEAIIAFVQESAAVIVRLSLSKPEKVKWLYELLACKSDNGTPGFSLALYYDNSDAISAFTQTSAAAMATLSESKEERPELIYGLFHSLKNDNKANFLATLKNYGGPAAKKAFNKGIDQLPLSAEQKETLKPLYTT